MSKVDIKKDQDNKISNDNLSLEEKELLDKSDAAIIKILAYEKKIYKRKGYGLILAILLAFSYIYFLPNIIHKFLPKENEIKNQGWFYALVAFWVHEIAYFIFNSLYIFIYFLKMPFFERYKVSSDP